MDEDFEENFSVIYEKARADLWDLKLKPMMIIFANIMAFLKLVKESVLKISSATN